MKTIAALLTVHNRKEQTLKCLQNISKVSLPKDVLLDIYLTDDGCTDGTPEAVVEKYPKVHIIKGDGNLFWNRGMYKAWEEAAKNDYDFYLWLNDDTYVIENFISVLLETSALKNDQAVIVGCTQSLDKKKITYGGRTTEGIIPHPNGTVVEVNHFNGNIVLVPKYVYNKVGNLDYYYRHSKGDFDYGQRAKKYMIHSYQAGQVLGYCDWHEKIDKWCDPNVPLCQRWEAMNRPTGMPPKETFHLNFKHVGFSSALVHYILIYVRCLFPSIWVKSNKVKEIK